MKSVTLPSVEPVVDKRHSNVDNEIGVAGIPAQLVKTPAPFIGFEASSGKSVEFVLS